MTTQVLQPITAAYLDRLRSDAEALPRERRDALTSAVVLARRARIPPAARRRP